MPLDSGRLDFTNLYSNPALLFIHENNTIDQQIRKFEEH